ncbi:MAG: BBP7 family outer membrane beta-barrel protein [Candidatus Protochlamydia sp.]|nr:BBP7 family outer membrane beta-barrel protein [Candidatus Protochlamydia sp.]
MKHTFRLQAIFLAFLLCFQTYECRAICTWLDDMTLNNCECDDCYACDCSQFWFEVDFLYWKIKQSPKVIPLVFAGPFNALETPTLFSQNTKVVLGNRSTQNNGRSGMEFAFGYHFTGPLQFSTELSYFFLTKVKHSHRVQSNDFNDDEIPSPDFPDNFFLAIPFYDVTTGLESSVFIAKPGEFAGKAELKVSNWMQGFEWNFSSLPNTLPFCTDIEIEALGGMRYWNFNEKLVFKTESPSTANPNVFTTKDQFTTVNSFYGVQAGLKAKWEYCKFLFTAQTKIALGAMDERLYIKGKLLTNDFNNFQGVGEFRGGFFALPTNIGFYDKFKFAYIPEFNLKFSYQLAQCITFDLGYTFFYVSRIFRPQNQLDRRINPAQAAAIQRQALVDVAGVERPKALLRSVDFWTQGLNVGINVLF